MEHSGDDLDQEAPIMGTCRAINFQSHRIKTDDLQNLNYVAGRLSNRQLTWNMGFEDLDSNDNGFYMTGTGATFGLSTTGPSNGYKSARLGAPPGEAYTLFADPVEVARGNEEADQYRTYGHARLEGSGNYKAMMSTALYVQPVTYPNPSNNCDYPDGLTDLNYRQNVGSAAFYESSVLTIQNDTAWHYFGTGFHGLSSTGQGFRATNSVRIENVGNVAPNTAGKVLIDNFRMEGR